MDEFYSKHYIRTDAFGNIVEGWSDGPSTRTPAEDDILINDKGRYQFRLAPSGEENPPLYGDNFIPLYKWDGKRALRRTEKEIEAELEALAKQREVKAIKPTQFDRIESQVAYTAMMTDTLLEG